MNLLKLEAQSSFERWKATSPAPQVVSPLQAIGFACAGFTALSVAVFATWAFGGRFLYGNLGELGAYAVWCVLFLLGAGLMRPALTGPVSWGRFYGLFLASFITYAVLWTVAWMALHNRIGEWLGTGLGMAGMAAVLCGLFGVWQALLPSFVVLFLGNAAGYFCGSWLHANTEAPWAQLLWGLCYGLGTGAGMGAAYYFCQAPLRALINAQGDRKTPRTETGLKESEAANEQ